MPLTAIETLCSALDMCFSQQSRRHTVRAQEGPGTLVPVIIPPPTSATQGPVALHASGEHLEAPFTLISQGSGLGALEAALGMPRTKCSKSSKAVQFPS